MLACKSSSIKSEETGPSYVGSFFHGKALSLKVQCADSTILPERVSLM